MNKLATTKNELPKLADLISEGSIDVQSKQDELTLLLSQQPPNSWVKEHPFVKNHLYIPIDKIEYLLRKIFRYYKIEVTGQGASFNGVWMTVRVHYLNPINNEWMFHDGVGAIQLQLRSQTSEEKKNGNKVLFAPENINNGALSMAYPHAKTLAIKDACDMFGDLFGANLNRRDTMSYQLDANLSAKASKQKITDDKLPKLIDNLKDGSISLEKVQELYDLTMEQMKKVLKASGVLNGK